MSFERYEYSGTWSISLLRSVGLQQVPGASLQARELDAADLRVSQVAHDPGPVTVRQPLACSAIHHDPAALVLHGLASRVEQNELRLSFDYDEAVVACRRELYAERNTRVDQDIVVLHRKGGRPCDAGARLQDDGTTSVSAWYVVGAELRVGIEPFGADRTVGRRDRERKAGQPGAVFSNRLKGDPRGSFDDGSAPVRVQGRDFWRVEDRRGHAGLE